MLVNCVTFKAPRRHRERPSVNHIILCSHTYSPTSRLTSVLERLTISDLVTMPPNTAKLPPGRLGLTRDRLKNWLDEQDQSPEAIIEKLRKWSNAGTKVHCTFPRITKPTHTYYLLAETHSFRWRRYPGRGPQHLQSLWVERNRPHKPQLENRAGLESPLISSGSFFGSMDPWVLNDLFGYMC